MTLFLIAHVADRVVAISTDQVDSVVDLGEIVPVPGAPPEVRGVAALRSRVVTVISSRTVLGAPPIAGPPRRAVISKIEGHHYAIAVSSLDDVVEADCEPLPPGLSLTGGWGRAACGTVTFGAEPLLAIDLAALVPTPALAA